MELQAFAGIAVPVILILSAACTAGFLSGIDVRSFCRDGEPVAARIFIAVLLTFDLSLLFWYLRAVLTASFSNSLLAGGISVGTGLALLVLVFLLPLRLLPDNLSTFRQADKEQRRRFSGCIWWDMMILSALMIWLLWLLSGALTDLPLLAATVLLFLLGLAGCLQAGLRAGERFEALVDKQYQAELLNFMQIIRSQRHDFNFHMQTVAGMIEKKEYEECTAYVKRMLKSFAVLNEVLPLADPAVSALLNTFSAIAAEKEIGLEIQILDPVDALPCTAYELNTILGNLIQNALDETAQKPEEERWIKLLIMKRSRKYIIKTSNPCSQDIEALRKVFEPGYTTKRSHEGIGLVTVKRITGKYGGSVTLEQTPGELHLIARLPVRTEKKRKRLHTGF